MLESPPTQFAGVIITVLMSGMKTTTRGLAAQLLSQQGIAVGADVGNEDDDAGTTELLP